MTGNGAMTCVSKLYGLRTSSCPSASAGSLAKVRESARNVPAELVQRSHSVGISRSDAEARETVQKQEQVSFFHHIAGSNHAPGSFSLDFDCVLDSVDVIYIPHGTGGFAVRGTAN